MSARVEDLQRAAARLSSARTAGIVGIVLGTLAFWLALPPATVRTALLPVALGLLAIAAGIWAFSRGERRVGGGAIVAGLVGIGGAILVMQATASNLEGVFVWSALIAATMWNRVRA